MSPPASERESWDLDVSVSGSDSAQFGDPFCRRVEAQLPAEWRRADLPAQTDPPGASEDLYRATLLFDRMVAYIDAGRRGVAG